MFEIAGQSPAGTGDRARFNAADTDISRRSNRRYTAHDFRALMARVSKGAAGHPAPSRTTTLPDAVPQAAAWHQPSPPRDEPEHLPDTQVPHTEAAADAPAASDVAADIVEAADVAQTVAIAAFDQAAPVAPDEGPNREFGPDLESPQADEAGTDNTEPPSEDSNAAVDPELQSAETARTLLDIMAMPSGVQPQERALAGDTLLRLVSRMPVASLIGLCDRLCIMDAPPPLLVRRLINHENVDVAGPLLERCPGISDQDLMSIINQGDVVILRLIARRRHLSPALTDALIRHGDASVTTTVVRNPGAALSHEAFNLLAATAKTRTSLQAPLATRADTPAPIAFELFWILPPQLRRYVLSRFLTESANLDRILKIAQALDESNGEADGSPRIADRAECDGLVALIAAGKTNEAARKLAGMAGICEANAQRIIADSEGEPLTVAMKAIGMSRTQSAAAAETLRDAPEAPLRSNRRIAELQNLFDSLSFTKARVLLTYWDWAVEQSGPYSDKTA